MSGAIAAMPGLASGAGVLTATASPPASNAGGTTANKTLPSVTAIPAGGTGPYTYSWAVQAPSSFGVINLTNTTSATVSIAAASTPPDTTCFAIIACTVTDTATGATATVQVTCSYERVGPH